MKKKTALKALALTMLIAAVTFWFSLGLWSSNISQNQQATKLFIEPPSIVYETLVPGKIFSINIKVTNVADLKGYELKLSFNTAMLGIVGISFLPEANMPVGNCKLDDPSGVVWMNTTYAGTPITTDNPVALATITFRMMNYGQSPLHLYGTTLVNSSGGSIPHDTLDGMVLILRHDIAIVDVAPSTSETYIGRIVNVTVVAQNNGNVPENFTVKVYHNETLFGTIEVISLAPSENFNIVFGWNTSDVVAGYSYTIKAEASIMPYEVNITNNVLIDGKVKVKIIGDVNNDDKVDINDLIAWDTAWGSSEGDPNWNPQADINGDGIVNNDDGVLIVQNYRTFKV